jgi:NADH:ubiquinone oxidoreductase subunit K
MNWIAQANVGSLGLQHFLMLGAFMFICGLLTILLKRNAIGILMGV